MNKIAVGIDIGGTNTVIGFVDAQGECLTKSELITGDYETAEAFVDAASNEINKTQAILDNCEIVGIGIGAPNGNFYNGTIEFAPNLKWKGVIPLVSLFAKNFSQPIVLTNDANAAAIGEMIYGNAKGMKNFIVITLGTGVGSGIVVNGELVYGHDGFAGEIGHTITYPDGRPCGCGRNGCLEAYCSAKGIVKTYMEISMRKKEMLEDDHQKITPKDVYDMACRQDATAIETYAYTGKVLGLSLANSVAHTSPEAIILFGGIANAGDLIMKPLRESLEENLLTIYKNKIKIIYSGIKENDAAVLGASSMIWKYLST